MRRHPRSGLFLRFGLVFAIVLAASSPGLAQWAYPRRFGGYGWNRWGADPGAGYMAASGAYARGQGAYDVELAKAQSIERDSLIKWNKALMAQRRALDAKKAQKDAQDQAEARVKIATNNLHNGSTLNDLLERILETDPTVTRAAAAKAPVTPELIRAIPFQTASEPISLCLDQLTEGEAWPFPLSDPEFAAGRQRVGQAIDRALQEDIKGEISPQTARAVKQAVATLHDQYEKNTSETEPGYYEGDQFLRTISGLTGMLQNPNVKPVLDELESYKGGTVGDLIAFMHTFNLRFGPAEDQRQREVYEMLAGEFERILTSDLNAPATASAANPDTSSRDLQNAAKDVFKGMSWDELHAGDGQAATP